MPRLLALLICIMGTSIAFAQVRDTAVIDESIPWKYGVSNASIGIHIMPLSVAVKHPRMRFGAIAEAGRWEFVFDVEYGNRYTQLFKTFQKLPYHFLGFRPEIRYSLHGNYLGIIDRYVGIEIPFNWISKTLVHDSYDAHGANYLFDRATFRRSRITALFKTGITVPIGERVYLDSYLGFGFGQRSVRYDDQVNLRENENFPVREWGFYQNPEEGIENISDFAMGFRIGYILSE
jgi:hypothetical protein